MNWGICMNGAWLDVVYAYIWSVAWSVTLVLPLLHFSHAARSLADMGSLVLLIFPHAGGIEPRGSEIIAVSTSVVVFNAMSVILRISLGTVWPRIPVTDMGSRALRFSVCLMASGIKYQYTHSPESTQHRFLCYECNPMYFFEDRDLWPRIPYRHGVPRSTVFCMFDGPKQYKICCTPACRFDSLSFGGP